MSQDENDNKGLSRRDFIKVAGSGAMALGISQAVLPDQTAARDINNSLLDAAYPRSGRGKRPYNIIFIATDQERYFNKFPEGTSFRGRELLKKKGTSFEKHYTCANMCTSSRSVIYTGQHIPHTGMFDNTGLPWQKNMSTDIPTIGDMLRKAGYYTAYKGKVHLSTEIESGKSGKIMTDAMEAYGFSDFNAAGDDYGHEQGGYQNDIPFSSDAISWLRTKGADLAKQNKPWFLALNLINPHDIMYVNTDAAGVNEQKTKETVHDVLRPPENHEYEKKYDDPLPNNLFQPVKEKQRPPAHYEYTAGWNHLFGAIPPKKANWRRYRDYYYNCLQDVDNQIVNILNALDNLGMLDSTIIVFTSDHGEMAGNHGLRGKGPFSYEENIHLPLYIVHPEHKGGGKCNAVTSHLDLAPTFISLAGMDVDTKTDVSKDLKGNDLTPLLRDPEKAGVNDLRPGSLFCFNMFMTIDSESLIKIVDMAKAGKTQEQIKASGIKLDLKKRGAMRTIFDGRYKFTRYFSPLQHNMPSNIDDLFMYNDIELFDLETDPAEMNNLAANRKKNKKLLTELNKKLNDLIRKEIGNDTGQELPNIQGVSWVLSKGQTGH